MSPAEFVNLVSEMRAAQRSYFRTRSHQALVESKILENQVDKIVRDGLVAPSVFDTPAEGVETAASALCDAVERYVCPKPGDKTCLRSELLNTKERLRKALKR